MLIPVSVCSGCALCSVIGVGSEFAVSDECGSDCVIGPGACLLVRECVCRLYTQHGWCVINTVFDMWDICLGLGCGGVGVEGESVRWLGYLRNSIFVCLLDLD